jgi:predicted RNA-binding protein with RPS1 domain
MTEEVQSQVEEQVVEAALAEIAPIDNDMAEPAAQAADPEGAEPEMAAEAVDDPGMTGARPAGASGPELAVEAGVESDDSGDDAAQSKRRVVRTLSIGQELRGKVKRTTDFGAFVDIGVGRDGLLHISELAVGRVNKVTDVVQAGQEVTVWIKKLDRERNRISLTMISPDTKTIRDLQEGDIVEGTVTRIVPYGAFVDIGVGRDALLHIREMSTGYVKRPEDVVQVGDRIETRLLSVSRRRKRIDLSLKGVHPEPEPEPEPEPMPEPELELALEPEPVARATVTPAPARTELEEETFEEMEALTPMELAFKRAMEAEGVHLNPKVSRRGKRNKRQRTRLIQEEIIARTLDTVRK